MVIIEYLKMRITVRTRRAPTTRELNEKERPQRGNVSFSSARELGVLFAPFPNFPVISLLLL